jgi:magnesium transporter
MYHKEDMSIVHKSLMEKELVKISFLELIKLRLPWLIVGLGGAMVASLIASRFELTLKETITIAFFIPIMTNMSDAIGTQTEIILIRALSNLKFNIITYIVREVLEGFLMGIVLSVLAYGFALFLSGSSSIALMVSIALVLCVTSATILACLTPLFLKFMGKDPAVGSGPFTTSLQDTVSLLIYLIVATLML